MGSRLINGLSQQLWQNLQGTVPLAKLERPMASSTGSLTDCTLGWSGSWTSVALGGSTTQSGTRGEP